MEKLQVRNVMLVHVRHIRTSNPKLNLRKVLNMVGKITIAKAGAFPAWRNAKGRFIITDGNHRLEALKRSGIMFAPIVEITRQEFDHVKFSTRTIDMMCRYPDKIQVIR